MTEPRPARRATAPRRLAALARTATLVAVAALVPASAGATSVVAQSLDSLVASPLIVRGEVVRLRGHAPLEKGHPFRVALVAVSEVVAGDAPTELWVRLPGGVGRSGAMSVAPGVPELARGDEVLLFLEPVPEAVTRRASAAPAAPFVGRRAGAEAAPDRGAQPERQWIPAALALGTWHVSEDDGRDGEAHATIDPAAHGLRVVPRAGGASVESLPARVTLREVRARAAALRAERAERAGRLESGGGPDGTDSTDSTGSTGRTDSTGSTDSTDGPDRTDGPGRSVPEGGR